MADTFDVQNGVVTANRVQIPGGVHLDDSGIYLSGQDAAGIKNLRFANPGIDNMNTTQGDLTIDNIAGKDKTNVLARGASIEFGAADETYAKAFRYPYTYRPDLLPALTGNDAGFAVYDAQNKKLLTWTGAEWA